MSASDACPPDDPGGHRLTVGYLLQFSWPLVATFLMMSAAAPIILHGITIIKDAEGERIHLSAYLLVASLAVAVYSPTFVSRDVANRTITDRTSLMRFVWFFGFWSALLSVVLVVISQVGPVRHWVCVSLLHGSASTEELAIGGLLVFATIPFLSSLRGLGQGCHINNGDTWHVGVGTALRLTAIAVFVYGFAIWQDMSGPVLGGLTYFIGMLVETVYVLVTLRNKPQWTRIQHGPALTFGQFTRYAGPLMLASLLLQLAPNILIIIIGKGAIPEDNKAAYSVTRDCCWLIISVILVVPPMIVTHAKSMANLRKVVRLCIAGTAVVTVVIGLLAVPVVRDPIFVTFFKVNNGTILSLISLGLLWFLPTPAMMFLNYLVSALHTRSGRTMWVTAGNLVGLGTLLVIATWPNLKSFNGVVLAVAGNAAFLFVSTLVQSVGLLRGGFAAAIDPSSLADRLRKDAAPDRPSLAEIDRLRVQVKEPLTEEFLHKAKRQGRA